MILFYFADLYRTWFSMDLKMVLIFNFLKVKTLKEPTRGLKLEFI